MKHLVNVVGKGKSVNMGRKSLQAVWNVPFVRLVKDFTFAISSLALAEDILPC